MNSQKALSSLVLLAFLAKQVCSYGYLGSLAPMWGEYFTSTTDNNRSPKPNSFAICVLEAGTLIPRCSGTFTSSNNTSPPSGLSLRALSAGGYFSCGLTYETGKPVCWGANITSPVPAPYRDRSYSSLSSGFFHVCALRKDGGMECWGDNLYGQLSPPKVNFSSVLCGGDFTCGLTITGEAQCWGWSEATKSRASVQPVNVFYRDIYAGDQHVCGIEKHTWKVFCWGLNDYKQCDAPGKYKFSSLALGSYHSCGIVKDRADVVCWGDDTFAQVSDSPRNETFSSLAATDFYTCGVSLTNLQSVRCWGYSNYTSRDVKASLGVCIKEPCGQEQYQVVDTDVGATPQCPVSTDRICLDCFQSCRTPPRLSSGNNKAIAIATGITGGICLLMGVVLYCYWRRRSQRKDVAQEWENLTSRIVTFSSTELAKATKNYSPDMILGQGGFGVVYKGILPSGQALAVKKSGISDDRTMVKELEMLSRLHHSNLVNLVGCCPKEKLLAFEFMSNGSLYDCLFKRPGLKLDWRRRIQIAAQAARGLEYLHVYASPTILHRDVKAANVLLDEHWNAHISDFGLSLLKAEFITHVSFVTVAGSPGYIDPEYIQTMNFSTKSDVYGFGVVLLELLTTRRAIEEHEPLVSWTIEQVERGSIVYESIFDGSKECRHALCTVLELALQCTAVRGKDRPSMTTVTNALEQVLCEVAHGNAPTTSYTTSSNSLEVEECIISPR